MKKFIYIMTVSAVMLGMLWGFVTLIKFDKQAHKPVETNSTIVEYTSAGWFSNSRSHTSLSSVESKVRNSAVRVEKPDGSGYGSGTYGYYDHQLVVFTANHVVDDNTMMIIHGRNGETIVGFVVYTDEANDFAVLKVSEMITREPIIIIPVDDVVSSYIGWNITYTGFPAGYDLLTIAGRIAGIRSDRQAVVAHSFTWMGASGSGVFNSRGRYVGPLVAVGLGRFQVTQVVEDMVWIIPATILNWDAVSEALIS